MTIKDRELPKLNVPEKYQPFEDVSLDRNILFKMSKIPIGVVGDGLSIPACILGSIAILLWVICMVIIIL